MTSCPHGHGDPSHDLAQMCAVVDALGIRPRLLPFYGHRPRGAGTGPWVLSQWWPQDFTVDGVTYPHAEAWMMAAKARLFGDQDALAAVLATSDPGKAKAIGRRVRGFDPSVWDQSAYDLVVEGNIAKFTQNTDLATYLASTGSRLLVEASPRDRIWGIGLSVTDPATPDPRLWAGQNLLGFALTHVRDHHLHGIVPTAPSIRVRRP